MLIYILVNIPRTFVTKNFQKSPNTEQEQDMGHL